MLQTEDTEKFFFTTLKLIKLMTHNTQQTHEESSATMLQFFALKHLEKKGETTVTDVVKVLNISKSSGTQLIERLVKAGLTERTHDEFDRRIIHLTITKKGQDELSELKKSLLGTISELLQDIPEEDILKLIEIQESIIQKLKNK